MAGHQRSRLNVLLRRKAMMDMGHPPHYQANTTDPVNGLDASCRLSSASRAIFLRARVKRL